MFHNYCINITNIDYKQLTSPVNTNIIIKCLVAYKQFEYTIFRYKINLKDHWHSITEIVEGIYKERVSKICITIT